MGIAEKSIRISEKFILSPESRERFLPLQLPAMAVLRQFDLGAGVSELVAPSEVGRPDPDWHTVVTTIQGEATCDTATSCKTLRTGETWILPAHQPHRYRPTGRWLTAWLALSDTERWTLLRDEPIQRLSFPNQMQMYFLMEGILAEALSPEADRESTLSLYAGIMAVLLERMLSRFDQPKAARMFESVRKLKEMIASQPGFSWTNEELAARLNISMTTLKRLIGAVEGKSPMEVVTDLRMQHTQELLHSTDHTLERIAGLVGYATPFALSRAFKQHVGISPQAFRVQARSARYKKASFARKRL